MKYLVVKFTKFNKIYSLANAGVVKMFPASLTDQIEKSSAKFMYIFQEG